MLATLQKLGVVPSFSRPSVSDDNAFAEALFRTFKYRPSYPSKPFGSLEAARTWVAEFVLRRTVCSDTCDDELWNPFDGHSHAVDERRWGPGRIYVTVQPADPDRSFRATIRVAE